MADSADHPMPEALDLTLAEFGIRLATDEAAAAFGRLAALEFASSLGLRPARRALSRERATLLKRCFSALQLTDTEQLAMVETGATAETDSLQKSVPGDDAWRLG